MIHVEDSDTDVITLLVAKVTVCNVNQVHVVPLMSRCDSQVTFVRWDKNNLYRQRLTKEEPDKAKAEEIEIVALSSKSTSTATLG